MELKWAFNWRRDALGRLDAGTASIGLIQRNMVFFVATGMGRYRRSTVQEERIRIVVGAFKYKPGHRIRAGKQYHADLSESMIHAGTESMKNRDSPCDFHGRY